MDPGGHGTGDPLTTIAGVELGGAQVPRHFAKSRRNVWPQAIHVFSLVTGLVIIASLDRHLWFFGDEWNFIADRGLNHAAQGIWQPHNEHWSTLPILIWRALFSVFALGSYWPYLVPLILAHLATTHLLWRAGRASGANVWIATLSSAIFVLFGAGAENLTWAFQITFVGSLMFGWAAILLGSRERSPITDGAVAALLVASLLCSAVGVAMCVAAAVSFLCQRGLRPAVRVLAVPAACFAVWYGLAGNNGVAHDHITLSTLSGLPGYVWDGLAGSLGRAVDLRPAGPVLLTILTVWVAVSFGRLRRESPSALAGVAGAVVFFVLTGLGREGQSGSATASRYVYVCVALLLPVGMVAVTRLVALARQPARILALCLAALILVVNLGLLISYADKRTSLVQANKRQLLAIGTLLAEGSPSLSPQPVPLEPDLYSSTLTRFVRNGTLPSVSLSASSRLDAEVGLDVATFRSPVSFARGQFILAGTSGPHRAVSSTGCLSLDPSVHQVALLPANGSATFELKSSPSVTFSVFLVSKASEKVPGNVLSTERSGVTYVADLVPEELLIVSPPSNGGSTLCGLRS